MDASKNTIAYNFVDFIQKFNVVPLIFSLIISLNLHELVNSFSVNIISPILNKLIKNDNLNLSERKVTIFGMTFGYGLFLIALIQFFVTVFILYIVYLLYINITENSQPFIHVK